MDSETTKEASVGVLATVVIVPVDVTAVAVVVAAAVFKDAPGLPPPPPQAVRASNMTTVVTIWMNFIEVPQRSKKISIKA
jgi:hypothetical protein